MSETEGAKRLYEACLSGIVETLNALLEKDPLILNRVGSAECFTNDTPLHVAVSCGHLEFTKALLCRKSKLATELDLQWCTPLHLASTEGHFEIVQELLRVNTDVCIARDQDGRTPLHLAVMKGRVEVIQELLRAQPDSVHDKLGRGETVLHLSVQYNRLEALKTLVEYLQSKNMESDLLNSKDDDGNTILHRAAALKQVNTIEYLLGIKSVKDCANDKNQNGCTALDIVEYCPPNRDLKTTKIQDLLKGVRRSVSESPQHCCGKTEVIFMKCIFWIWDRFKVDRDWLKEARGHLITASTLTATMAYQSIMSPPGGFWQDTKPDPLAQSPSYEPLDPHSEELHEAGIAILDTMTYGFGGYEVYLSLNTIVLGASLSTIMLAMTGFPMKNKFLTWLLVFTVYVKISCMAAAYVVAVALVTDQQLPSHVLYGLMFGWMGLCAFVVVLHSCHFLVWLVKKVKLVSGLFFLVWLVKICCKPTPSATPKNRTSEDNLAGSHKCVGSFC